MSEEPKWAYEYKEYPAYMVRVVDGDTIDFILDLGFNLKLKERVRVQNIDAPEQRTTDLVEKEAGIAATKFVEQLFEASGRCVTVVVSNFQPAKYDRVIGDVVFPNGVLLSEAMIMSGHAEPYGATG